MSVDEPLVSALLYHKWRDILWRDGLDVHTVHDAVEVYVLTYLHHSPHVDMRLDAVESFVNSSGCHHELRSLHQTVDVIKAATSI